MLEHHADTLAHAGHVAFRQFVEPAAVLAVADELAADP